jgi:hypothetical protein
LWIHQWTFTFYKRQGVSWLAEWILVFQEGLCSMQLVSWFDLVTGQIWPKWPLHSHKIKGNWANCSTLLSKIYHHHIQTGSGAHLASPPEGTRNSFPVDEVIGACSWPLTSI